MSYKILLDVINVVPIKVRFNSLEENFVGKKTAKVQFMGMLNPRRAQLSDEKFLLKIKKGLEMPKLDTKTSIRTVNFSRGVVATVIDRDEDFCIEKNCEYSILLITNNISACAINTNVFDNFMPIEMGYNTSIIDELRSKDYMVYHLKPIINNIPESLS